MNRIKMNRWCKKHGTIISFVISLILATLVIVYGK